MNPVYLKSLAWGAAAGALALLALGALTLTAGADFDYAGSSEEEQQRILDEMASAFRFSLPRAFGAQLRVVETRANAGEDLVWVDAQIVDPRFEDASDEHVALFEKGLYAETCNAFQTRKLVEDGASVRFRIARPSGRSLADFVFDTKTCAPYMRAAVG